ncbi:hypothetical protein, partial [Candidatus Magnetobacterium casense]|uniref:hypothetical protein n=1 Tax=Candidatus Magnetobacterium casense TaxID=1455061 RepID=UPI001C46C001
AVLTYQCGVLIGTSRVVPVPRMPMCTWAGKYSFTCAANLNEREAKVILQGGLLPYTRSVTG